MTLENYFEYKQKALTAAKGSKNPLWYLYKAAYSQEIEDHVERAIIDWYDDLRATEKRNEDADREALQTLDDNYGGD